MVSAEFTVNNKVHLAIKVSLFMENYGRKLRMEIDIRRKEKIEKAIELTKRIRKVQEEPEMVLRKIQKEMKQQADEK